MFVGQVASLDITELAAAGFVPVVNYLGLGMLAVICGLVGAAVIGGRQES
jgi:hypothetical protein